MHLRLSLAVCSFLISLVPAALGQGSTGNPHPAADYGRLPLSFEANRGQVDPHVRFTSQGQGYSISLTDSAAVLALNSSASAAQHGLTATASLKKARIAGVADILRMEVAGAAPGARVTGEEHLPGTANYFIGNDPAQWQTNLPTYARVRYKDIYPGIDLAYYGNQRQLEYDFILAPGADPHLVRLHFQGSKMLQLAPDGDLKVVAQNGDVVFHKPVVYQLLNGQRQQVQGSFRLLAGNNVSFTLGSYDRERELVIDPVLAYSTYFGATAAPSGNAIAVDASGNAYIAGITGSGLPTTKGAFQHSTAPYIATAFVSKINAAGTALLYSTYLGGSKNAYDYANSIAVDAAGDAYVTGGAYSTNFPVTGNAYQKVNKGAALGVSDAFLTKLNPTGTGLVYSTYLGGSGSQFESGIVELALGDQATSVAIDPTGNAYLTGLAYSYDFPISKGAFQSTNTEEPGSSSVFVTKVNAAGSGLIYSTYLGGSVFSQNGESTRTRPRLHSRLSAHPLTVTGGDQYPNSQVSGDDGYGIAVDATGDAYVTGFAETVDFPTTPGAYKPQAGISGSGAFVSKFNSTGTALVYSAIVAGSCYDGATAIALDAAGDAFITGAAGSSDFPTTASAFQTINHAVPTPDDCQIEDGVYNAFVTKLNPSGTSLVFSTLLGGTVGDEAEGIVIDKSGNSYVTGNAGSPDFPLSANALDQDTTANNAFVSEVNTTGTALLYSTAVGGSSGQSATYANGIAIDKANSVYITGSTGAVNFPVTSKPLQPGLGNGEENAFVSKFAFPQSGIATAVTLTSSVNPQKAGKPVTFTVHVKPLTGDGIPAGTVVGSANGSDTVTEKLDSTGSATFTNSNPASGIYTVVATYSGDSTYAGSTGDLHEVVSGGAGSIQQYISCSATYGEINNCRLVAIVYDVFGSPLQGAVVHFSGTGLKFASPTVATDASGQAAAFATATIGGTLTAYATVEGVSYPAIFSVPVTPAVLTVTAKDITVAYDQPIPALSYTISGYVNGDTSSVVTGSATETTTASKGSPAGTYPITLAKGTLAAKNYTFQFVKGTVTITPAQ